MLQIYFLVLKLTVNAVGFSLGKLSLNLSLKVPHTESFSRSMDQGEKNSVSDPFAM